jgi:precorrin-8X/cobalt-precorrin-8 methylmutase
MGGLLSRSIIDDDRNVSNRFEVASALNERITASGAPFWGCPPSHAGHTLTATKPASFAPLGEWRAVETALRERCCRPFSSWQLLGAGAVGSQSLLGIPMIHRLSARFVDRVSVWPFTTGLRAPTVDSGTVVIAEVWPSLLPIEVADGAVRDEAQVIAVAEWLADLDATGRLAAQFAPDVAGVAEAARIEREEGWVLGVGH